MFLARLMRMSAKRGSPPVPVGLEDGSPFSASIDATGPRDGRCHREADPRAPRGLGSVGHEERSDHSSRARSTFGADEITGASPADASRSDRAGCREFVQSLGQTAELPLAGKHGRTGPREYLIVE
jgi:hypothetical protein